MGAPKRKHYLLYKSREITPEERKRILYWIDNSDELSLPAIADRLDIPEAIVRRVVKERNGTKNESRPCV